MVEVDGGWWRQMVEVDGGGRCMGLLGRVFASPSLIAAPHALPEAPTDPCLHLFIQTCSWLRCCGARSGTTLCKLILGVEAGGPHVSWAAE